MHMGNIHQAYGRTILIDADRYHIEVVEGLDVTQTSHHVLGFRHLNQAPTYIVVGSLNRHLDFAQRDVVAIQGVGIDFNLVLLDITTHGGNLRYPLHSLERVT